MIIHQKNM